MNPFLFFPLGFNTLTSLSKFPLWQFLGDFFVFVPEYLWGLYIVVLIILIFYFFIYAFCLLLIIFSKLAAFIKVSPVFFLYFLKIFFKLFII
jgi:hypothetical protein